MRRSIRISLFGLPAMPLTLAGVGYLRGLQDTKRPLYVAIGTAVLNLVVEVVPIFGLDFGIGAPALSTVIAQWVGAMAYLVIRAIAENGVGLGPDRACSTTRRRRCRSPRSHCRSARRFHRHRRCRSPTRRC